MLKRTLLNTSALTHAAPNDQGVDQAAAHGATTPERTAHQREKEATDLAFLADNDDQLQSDLQAGVEAAEKTKVAAVNIYLDLKDVYGDKLNGFPEPGTTDKESNNPAIYDRPVRRKGGVGTAKANWINDFADHLKWVRETIIEPKLAMAESNTSEMKKEAFASKMDGRLSTARKNVGQAIALHHQIARAEAYPSIEFEWVQDEENVLDEQGQPVLENGVAKTTLVLASTDKPVCIVSTKNRKDFFYLSVQQFLGLDFDEARAKGGTVDSLMATKKRDSGADDGTGSNQVAVTTREQYLGAMYAECSFLDAGKNYTDFLAWLKVESQDSNEALLVASKLAAYYSGMIAPHAKRIEKLEINQANAA